MGITVCAIDNEVGLGAVEMLKIFCSGWGTGWWTMDIKLFLLSLYQSQIYCLHKTSCILWFLILIMRRAWGAGNVDMQEELHLLKVSLNQR